MWIANLLLSLEGKWKKNTVHEISIIFTRTACESMIKPIQIFIKHQWYRKQNWLKKSKNKFFVEIYTFDKPRARLNMEKKKDNTSYQ